LLQHDSRHLLSSFLAVLLFTASFIAQLRRSLLYELCTTTTTRSRTVRTDRYIIWSLFAGARGGILNRSITANLSALLEPKFSLFVLIKYAIRIGDGMGYICSIPLWKPGIERTNEDKVRWWEYSLWGATVQFKIPPTGSWHRRGPILHKVFSLSP
jgi:hypothetical protein